MIKDSKIPGYNYLFRKYIQCLLKKNFSGFYLAGNVPEISAEESLLILPNHFSWWDGFFIYIINELYLKKDFKIMMLESQLSKYKMFRYSGAFSINPGSIISVRESLTYALSVLKVKNSAVVFYPQGEIEIYGGEIKAKKGIMHLIDNAPDTTKFLLPSFKIFYFEDKKPAVAVYFKLAGKESLQNIDEVNELLNGGLQKLDEIVLKKKFIGNLFDSF